MERGPDRFATYRHTPETQTQVSSTNHRFPTPRLHGAAAWIANGWLAHWEHVVVGPW